MHFSETAVGHASAVGHQVSNKFTKLALVAAFHLAVGAVLVQNMNMRSFTMPQVPADIDVSLPKTYEPPPPPAEPPPVEQTTAHPPTFSVPLPEIAIERTQPNDLATVTVTPAHDDAPPLPPGPVTPKVIPTPDKAGAGVLRSAVLADAKSCVTPEYPARAARIGETGTVALALLVDASGAVTSSRVQRSSGSRELDRAAQSALSMCRFKPAMEGGVAVAGWAQISYVWTLD